LPFIRACEFPDAFPKQNDLKHANAESPIRQPNRSRTVFTGVVSPCWQRVRFFGLFSSLPPRSSSTNSSEPNAVSPESSSQSSFSPRIRRAVIGIVVGGKLADRHGRRIIGAIGIAGGVLFTVISYLSWGWPLWLASVAAAVIGAVAVPALAVYGPELFPTSQRGTANGGLQVVAVAGSSLGLLIVGWLADRVEGLGHAMAVVAIAPALLIFVVLFWFPETARRELEELNPSDHEHNQ